MEVLTQNEPSVGSCRAYGVEGRETCCVRWWTTNKSAQSEGDGGDGVADTDHVRTATVARGHIARVSMSAHICSSPSTSIQTRDRAGPSHSPSCHRHGPPSAPSRRCTSMSQMIGKALSCRRLAGSSPVLRPSTLAGMRGTRMEHYASRMLLSGCAQGQARRAMREHEAPVLRLPRHPGQHPRTSVDSARARAPLGK